MNLKTRKRVFKLCEPVGPDDTRYADVDAMPGAVRGRSWVDLLELKMDGM